MSRFKRLLPLRSIGAALRCTLAVTLPASSAATFTYTTIDPPGSIVTYAVAINGKRIVGYYGLPSGGGVGHEFLATK